MDRLLSGHSRLDAVLGGGLPANAIHLIAGPPGSGKTILAEQYAFANATVERPAVYLSTVSEPLDKLVRFGQTLNFSISPASDSESSTRVWANFSKKELAANPRAEARDPPSSIRAS